MYKELYELANQRFAGTGTDVPLSKWITDYTTLRRRPFNYNRYPFQEAIANDEHPNLSVIKCSQVGLATSLDSEIITPNGWTTMGAISVGDELFDENGNITTVTYKSPIWENRDCYVVEFDDGTKVTVDGSHKWKVKTTRGPFNPELGVYQGRGRPAKNLNYTHEGVVNTEFLSQNHKLATFYIPVTKPLDLPEADLPVDPYVLGVWLGDGSTYSATLTIGDEDYANMSQLMRDRGVELVPSSKLCYRMVGLHKQLDKIKVLRSYKKIPIEYLKGSINQRYELLRGLMDSDGSITKRGRASFHNTNPQLISDVTELLHSLGFKTHTRWRTPKGDGFGGKLDIAEVSFVPKDIPVFNLERKRTRQIPSTRLRFTEHRTIISVCKTDSVPTQCIMVDSPNHLFLISKSMIPTHNTEIQIRKFFGMLRRENGLSGIFSFPNEAMYKRNYATRMKPIIDNDDIFNPSSINKPIRRMDLTQIGDSFGYVTGCGESDATSINADILFHDELDLSPSDMIALFQSRLQGSDKRITQRFSTPTFLGYGIDREFSLSDQHFYMVRCGACNHWQFPLFNQTFVHIPKFKFEVENLTDLTGEQISDLNLKGAYIGCERCHKPLKLGDKDFSQWVPRLPERINNRGYKMNPFSTDRLPLEYIFGQLQKYKEKENLKGFFNTVLGEPFTESSAQLQRDQILECMAANGNPPNVGKETAVYMGIDMGQTCHIVLCGDVDSDGKDPFFLFDTCNAMQLPQRIMDLRKVYNIVQCCVDRYPYTPTVDAFRENTNGLIMPIHFGGNSALQPKFDEAETLVYYIANRTSMLDRVRTVISNGTAVLAGYGGYKETLITHLRDMVRDETAIEKEPEWKKLNGNDHFFFAAAYALLARRVCENIFTRQFSKSLMVMDITTAPVGGIDSLIKGNGINKLGFGR